MNLGGKRVEMIPRPTAHADDNTIVRFVDGANVLFASDWITVDRIPFGGDVGTNDEIALVKRLNPWISSTSSAVTVCWAESRCDGQYPLPRGAKTP